MIRCPTVGPPVSSTAQTYRRPTLGIRICSKAEFASHKLAPWSPFSVEKLLACTSLPDLSKPTWALKSEDQARFLETIDFRQSITSNKHRPIFGQQIVGRTPPYGALYGGYLSNRARKTRENIGKPIKLRVLILDFVWFSLVLLVFPRFS